MKAYSRLLTLGIIVRRAPVCGRRQCYSSHWNHFSYSYS